MKHIEKYYLVKLATTANPMKEDSITEFYAKDNMTPATNSQGGMIKDLFPRQTKFKHYDAAFARDPYAWLHTPDLISKQDYFDDQNERLAKAESNMRKPFDWAKTQGNFIKSLFNRS